jgi:NAD(P)-dependent dehydrogenase (short-subunit alcohol dehydrogenase family)
LPQDRLAKLEPALQATKSTLHRIECDLSRYASVREFAAAIASDHPEEVDVLVLCAGMVGGARRVTQDGEEETLQVNTLSQALLVDLLIHKLGNAQEQARILFVGSALHRKILPGKGPACRAMPVC